MFHKPAQPLSNISPCGRPIPIGSKLPHLGDVARQLSGRLGFFFPAGPSWVRVRGRVKQFLLEFFLIVTCSNGIDLPLLREIV